MENESKTKEESSLEDELYGDKHTAPNTLSQPSIGVQASIVKRLLEDEQDR
jgi:hypothetical protein